MIGNDIIDLQVAEKESNWQRKGFLEKQFTPKEQIVIHASENPFKTVWRLWSMKESVYKIVVQQQHKRFFAPQKLECKMLSETDGEVQFENQYFPTKTIRTDTYIYTTTGQSDLSWLGMAASNNRITEIIAQKLHIDEVEIMKNEVGVPSVYHKNEQISQSFSKTHHGAYQAFEINLVRASLKVKPLLENKIKNE